MGIKINSSGKEVIFFGTFTTFSKDKNELSFNYGKEEFKFEFHFIRDDSKKQTIDYSPNQDNSILVLKFYNFNNVLGTGLIKPLKVATTGDKPIYLQVFISSINDDLKNVNYTFYLGDSNE